MIAIYRLLRVGFLGLALNAPALSAAAQDVVLSQIVGAPNPRLGLAFPGGRTEFYPLIAQAGIGVARVSAAWARVEPTNGRVDWSGLDRRVLALQKLGVEPFLTFESNAAWATARDSQGVKNARPVDLADWERFVHAVVERYDADGLDDTPGLLRPVRYWQAANEWISDRNRSGGWVGETDALVAYVERAHDAVKAAAPDAVFVMGGIAAFNIDVLLVARGGLALDVRQKWSETSETVFTISDMRGPEIAKIIDDRVLPVLRRAPYDVAAVHLYGPEDRDAARIAFMRDLTGKPVLSSECGGPSLDYGGVYTPRAHFNAVIERNLGVLATGAEFCLWFLLGEGPGATWGNRRTALYTSAAEPKPGVFAYRLLSRLLGAATHVEKVDDALFALREDGGDAFWIGWGASATAARDRAIAAGGETLCLSDPVDGTMSAARSDCAAGDLVLGGRDLVTLLAR